MKNYRRQIADIISRMLDNPDKHGIVVEAIAGEDLTRAPFLQTIKFDDDSGRVITASHSDADGRLLTSGNLGEKVKVSIYLVLNSEVVDEKL